MTAYILCRERLLPIHILPPFENAQNHLFASLTSSYPSSSFSGLGIHLSGLNASGSGYTRSFRCKQYGDMLICTPPGMVYPSIVVPAGGTTRFWGIGVG